MAAAGVIHGHFLVELAAYPPFHHSVLDMY